MRSPVRRLTLPLIGQPASGGPTSAAATPSKSNPKIVATIGLVWLGTIITNTPVDQAVM